MQFKYKFAEELAYALGKIMRHQFVYFSHTLFKKGDVIVVPVPLHKKRLNYRGFNQSLLLAECLSKNSRDLKIYDCLLRTGFYQQQAKSIKEERFLNLQNSIICKNSYMNFIKDRVVVLVDDISTTCSTLNECAKALKIAGAKYVCGLVLARGHLFANGSAEKQSNTALSENFDAHVP